MAAPLTVSVAGPFSGRRRCPHQVSRARGRGPGAVVVSGCGDLDEAAGDLLRGILSDLIEGQGNGFVVVDLGSVTTIGRSAVKVLSAAADSARRRGARMILVNASADVRAALNTPGAAGGSPVTGGPLR